MLIKILNKWFINFQKYFFTYKDGFFELPYLANNPKTMVKSFAKMPFNKHYINKNCFISNNPFIYGELYYRELEDELWVFYGEVNYKTNVSYNLIYDKSLPIDYYTLSYNKVTNKVTEVGFMIDDVSLNSSSWSLFKPKGNLKNYHFKNNTVANLFLCFTQNWYDKNIKEKVTTNSVFNDFIKNEAINYIINNEDVVKNLQLVEHNIQLIKNNSHSINTLKENAIKLFLDYIENINQQEKPLQNIFIPDKDRIKIYKIQAYLLENLQTKFIGIDALSTMFRVSPTKLKHDFKNVFGQSIFSYFQSKQIELAKVILLEGNRSIAEIASAFEYNNPSKFSKTFKKITGFLPSEFSKN